MREPMKTFAICIFALFATWFVARAGQPSVSVEPLDFGSTIPARYSAVSSAVIQYRWFKLPALGVLTVDTPGRHFALVGLSQIGISLFELSETNGHVKCRMPGHFLKCHPQIAKAAAADVRQMFFGLAPSAGAQRFPCTRRNTTLFREGSSGGTMEYRFDKNTGFLLEKRFSVSRKILPGSSVVWRILYEDYAPAGRSSYPRIIRFKQREHHYAITLFLKELRINP
jgi:hypothetical protein